MENDSLNVVEEGASGDTLEGMPPASDMAEMPTPEQLGISVTAGVSGGLPGSIASGSQGGAAEGSLAGNVPPLSVTVGDTFDFPVTVSWHVNGSALLVLPTNSATAKGLEQVGVSQESARSVKDGQEMASITFTYKIVAQDTGNLNIPVLKFEIPTPMGQPLVLRTESVPVRVDAPSSFAPAIVGIVVALAVVMAGLWRAKRRAVGRAAAAAREAADEELRQKMLVLKQRVNVADSRQWLQELECICKEFVARKMGLDANRVFLDVLHKAGDLDEFGGNEGWKLLLEKFADARYGGGRQDPFENRENWKLAMKLMGVSDE